MFYHRRTGPVSLFVEFLWKSFFFGGGGGAEVSCPSSLSSACPKTSGFARKLLFLPENGHLKYSRGCIPPTPPPPPPPTYACMFYSDRAQKLIALSDIHVWQSLNSALWSAEFSGGNQSCVTSASVLAADWMVKARMAICFRTAFHRVSWSGSSSIRYRESTTPGNASPE